MVHSNRTEPPSRASSKNVMAKSRACVKRISKKKKATEELRAPLPCSSSQLGLPASHLLCSPRFSAMGSYVKQLSAKANVASEFLFKHGSVYYKKLLENNKQYISQEPTIQKCQELSRQLFYTRLASIPGRYESFWKEVDYLKNMVKNRHDITVEDLGVTFLFTAECYAWFVVGEIVGRGFTLTGYYP